MLLSKALLGCLIFFISSLDVVGQIQGKWDLVENETIESIRNSEGFLLSDFERQSSMELLFSLSLDSVFYEFIGDTLYYDDLDPEKLRTIGRRAFWSLHHDTLSVKEIDRIFFRRYYVKKLTPDSLLINVIFEDGFVSKKSLKFIKINR